MLVVSSEYYFTTLYQLIKLCLLVATLRIWKRIYVPLLYIQKMKLNSMMKFSRHEIENGGKVPLARSGFNLENVNKNIYIASSRRERDIPTAMKLHNSSKISKITYVFL